MRGLGAFAGGLATGIATGHRMHQDRERSKREKEAHEVGLENARLDLDRKRQDEEFQKAIKEAGSQAFKASLGGEHQDVDPVEGLSTVSRKNPFGERGAMIDGAEAMAAEAIRRGRMDVAQQHLQGASAMRTRLRSELAGEAVRKLDAGDPSGMVQLYDLVPDGVSIVPDSVKPVNKGGAPAYEFKVRQDGEERQMTLTREELMKQFSMWADPQKSFEMDVRLSAERALQKWKWDNNPEHKEKVRHNQAVEELKGKEIEAIRDYRRATLALRQATADKRGQLTPKDINTIIDKGELGFRKLIEAEVSKEDAKINVNSMMTLLPAMKAELGSMIRSGKDPEVAFESTFYRYRDLVGSLNDSLSNAVADADRGWGRAAKVKRMETNLQRIMEEKGLSREELKKFIGATRVGSSNAIVRQALASLPQARAIGGTPGLEPAQPPAENPAASGGRPRADAFFN